MIFQKTLGLVLTGKKTQTRRLALPEVIQAYPSEDSEELMTWGKDDVPCVFKQINGKVRRGWYVGQKVAVQPGRGKKAVAYVEITGLRYQYLREMGMRDYLAEGFSGIFEFIQVWNSLHKKHGDDALEEANPRVLVIEFKLVE